MIDLMREYSRPNTVQDTDGRVISGLALSGKHSWWILAILEGNWRCNIYSKRKKGRISGLWLNHKKDFLRIIRFESKNIRISAFVTPSINAKGLFFLNMTYRLTHRSGMDFLERQQITFFIITGLTELWSRTGSCFERRFDFVVGDIVDSTYLTDRFFKRQTELGKSEN